MDRKKKGYEKTESIKNTLGLIKTEWHQHYPFYGYCPVSKDTTLVGCAPLAMSQLMKYYSYPIKGLENFSNTTYDWANMPAYDSLMITQVQRDTVARICRDAGESINAKYGISVTTATFEDIPYALAKNFNYTAQLRTEASWYDSLDIWIDSLKTSLGRSQPIIYGGLIVDTAFTADHAWIINGYKNIPEEQFHFNMGDSNKFHNRWYSISAITSVQNAIFNVIPDKTENALSIPYKEDFEDVIIGSGIFQIPENIGVSHTVTFDYYSTFFTQIYDTTKKGLYVRNSGVNSQWFVLKKIKLDCESVPVLKFSKRILDQTGLIAPSGQGISVDVSKDNRLTWNQVYSLNYQNYNISEYEKSVEHIISLEEFKNDTVNIRFQFPYNGSNNFCLIDDIEIGELDLYFTDLSYDDILQPSDAQSIKVTPSIVTPPKSKGFEDYDMVMDFYVKEDSTATDFTLMYSDSLLENGVFEYPNWDTNDLFGKKYLIRAVARTKSNNTTLDSTETRVEFSGRQCYVTYPPNRTDSTTFFDVELALTIDGYIEAEAAFRDTLDADIVLVEGYIYDIQRGMWIYEENYLPEYFCNPNAYIYSLAKEGDKPLFEYKEVDSDYIPKQIHSENKFNRVKRNIPEPRESKSTNSNVEITKEHFQYNRLSELQGLGDYYTKLENASKSATKDMVQYDTTYYEHTTSLNLYPGFYWIEAGAYYKDSNWEVIAAYENMTFLIPNWKLKLKEDPWYPGAVPHNSLREYAQNDDVYIEIWRPFDENNGYNIVDISITRDSDEMEVATFQVDYNTKGKRYVEWETTGATEPGFYTITAIEQFETTNYIVTQKETIQICPLYEHWEHGGTWADGWQINTDNDYFRIHNFVASHAGIGDYSLGATYNTETGESIDESLSSDGVSFNLQHDAVFEVFMGLPYDGSNFEEMYADYKMLLSKDGGMSWTAIRQANVSDYTPYAWNPIPGYKFINWWTPIRNTAAEENMIVKFVSQNHIAPQDTISQQICFDEIQIRYRTEPVPDGGQNFAGTTDGSKVDLSWDTPTSKGLTPTLYYIYRNGSDLAVTASTSYTDYSITGDTMYNYSVVAYYEDSETGAWDVSSMLDCSVDIFVSSLTTPANVLISENSSNVTITWDTVAGASSYIVYSSVDPYGTFTVNTSGTFNGEQWVTPLIENGLFYYVVATDVSKREKINNNESVRK